MGRHLLWQNVMMMNVRFGRIEKAALIGVQTSKIRPKIRHIDGVLWDEI